MGRNNDILENYSGATVLTFLCDYTSLSIDQVNFISCQLIALFLSVILKKWIHNPLTRLWFSLVVGLSMCVFCFGTQTFHILISGGLSYLVMKNTRTMRLMPWIVFGISMIYLSFLHLKRQFYDQSQYSLDITGPLMVLTQKTTSLAFSLRDGIQLTEVEGHDKKATSLQKRYAINSTPDSLYFSSYVFQFQSMLAGPLVFYKDYQEFIEKEDSPNAGWVVVKKLALSIVVAVLFLKLGSQFKFDYVRGAEFLDQTTFFYKLFYLTMATTLERCKYYHAWILADAVCNASGLGYDRMKGSWDLVSNVDALNFELGSNMKESLDLWNMGTMKWLRMVIYERANPTFRTALVYLTSAFWHGFYPGYYITFISGALFTEAARAIRRSIRPLFVGNRVWKALYDFITWATTRLVIAYVTFSFVVQDFWPSIQIFMRLYFFIHVGAALSLPLAPLIGKSFGSGRGGSSSSSSDAKPSRKPSDKNLGVAKTKNGNGVAAAPSLTSKSEGHIPRSKAAVDSDKESKSSNTNIKNSVSEKINTDVDDLARKLNVKIKETSSSPELKRKSFQKLINDDYWANNYIHSLENSNIKKYTNE